jgi:hypothetical protein
MGKGCMKNGASKAKELPELWDGENSNFSA